MRFKMCECNFGERTPKYISGKRNGKKMKEEEEKKRKMETSDSLLCIQAIISSVFCNQLHFSCEAEHTVSHHVQKKLGHPFVSKNLKMYAGFTKKRSCCYGQRTLQDLDHRSISFSLSRLQSATPTVVRFRVQSFCSSVILIESASDCVFYSHSHLSDTDRTICFDPF